VDRAPRHKAASLLAKTCFAEGGSEQFIMRESGSANTPFPGSRTGLKQTSLNADRSPQG
jgi:hypothetical protein